MSSSTLARGAVGADTGSQPQPGSLDLAAASRPRAPSAAAQQNGLPAPPCTCPWPQELDEAFQGVNTGAAVESDPAVVASSTPLVSAQHSKMLLELVDGTAAEGYSFGADVSATGECVFQTGKGTLL